MLSHGGIRSRDIAKNPPSSEKSFSIAAAVREIFVIKYLHYYPTILPFHEDAYTFFSFIDWNPGWLKASRKVKKSYP